MATKGGCSCEWLTKGFPSQPLTIRAVWTKHGFIMTWIYMCVLTLPLGVSNSKSRARSASQVEGWDEVCGHTSCKQMFSHWRPPPACQGFSWPGPMCLLSFSHVDPFGSSFPLGRPPPTHFTQRFKPFIVCNLLVGRSMKKDWVLQIVCFGDLWDPMVLAILDSSKLWKNRYSQNESFETYGIP